MVWIPKCRRKALYGQLRQHLGEIFRDLARQKESKVLEGHLQADHIHMLIAIPPKYAVAQVIGYMKGKSAIHIARTYLGQRKNFSGMSLIKILWSAEKKNTERPFQYPCSPLLIAARSESIESVPSISGW